MTITVDEITAFETFMKTFEPAPDGGHDFLEKLCAAARAGVATRASDNDMKDEYDFSSGTRGKFFRPGAKVSLPELSSAVEVEASTVHAIVKWLEERADLLRPESPHNAAGVLNAARAIRAGDWTTARPRRPVEPTSTSTSAPEAAPIATDRRPSWEILLAHTIERLPRALLLHEDMRERDRFGRQKYNVPLTSGNGRNHLVDAYQELLDFGVYLTNELDEQGFPPRVIGVRADGDRASIAMPADIFALHDLLRETIFHLSSLRLMIERRNRHGRGSANEGDAAKGRDAGGGLPVMTSLQQQQWQVKMDALDGETRNCSCIDERCDKCFVRQQARAKLEAEEPTPL